MNLNSPVLANMLRNSRNSLQPATPVRSAVVRPQSKAAPTAGSARFNRWHVPEITEREPDSWLLTYLDLITLLLVVLLVLLALTRLGPERGQRSKAPMPVAMVSSLHLPASVPLSAEDTHAAAHWLDLSFPLVDDVTLPSVLTLSPEAEVAPPVDTEPATAPATGHEPGAIPGPAVSDAPPLTPPSIDELGLDELRDSVDVLINSQSISFRISNELLFPSGQAQLHAGGLEVLKRLATVLNRSNYPISVEGHSDNVPIQTRYFPSNWELSSSRATSVLRGLQRAGVASSRLRAVGYADTRPLVPNDTPKGRAANRRVELIMEITPANKRAALDPQLNESVVETAHQQSSVNDL